MSRLVTDHMEASGIPFLWQHVPESVEKKEDGSLSVRWRTADGQEGGGEFDTVMFAVGEHFIHTIFWKGFARKNIWIFLLMNSLYNSEYALSN